MIPARVRNESNPLRRKGLASVWAPACQDSSHVGNAGVGVVSLRRAPVALPSFGTSQFKVFFELVGPLFVASWCWSVSWFDELARILLWVTKVEDVGLWPDGLLDAYKVGCPLAAAAVLSCQVAMIPKTDGDATPLGQRPLSVLPVVYRIWASARMSHVVDGAGVFLYRDSSIAPLLDLRRSSLGCLIPFSVLEVVVVRLRLGILLLLILKRFSLVLPIPHLTFTCFLLLTLGKGRPALTNSIMRLGWFKSFDTVDRVILDSVSCPVLGFLAGFVMLILSTVLMFGCGLSWLLVFWCCPFPRSLFCS